MPMQVLMIVLEMDALVGDLSFDASFNCAAFRNFYHNFILLALALPHKDNCEFGRLACHNTSFLIKFSTKITSHLYHD